MKNSAPSFLSRRTAAIAGFSYLLTIAQGVFDHIYVNGKLLAPDGTSPMVHNIMAHEALYRLAFALDLVPAYAVVTAIFFQWFRPVKPGVALLAALVSVLGASVGLAASVFQFAPVALLSAKPVVSGLGYAESEGLSLAFLRLREIAFTISLLYFGLYCFLVGKLIGWSQFMPRTVGVLMMLGGLAYSVYGLAYFAVPGVERMLAPAALSLGSLGEIALTVWLLAFGLRGSTTLDSTLV